MKPGPKSRDLILRITENVKEDSNLCWIWQRQKSSTGYGKITVSSKKLFAHRVSYEVFKGNIPENKIVMHTCDNPSCVNPDHLKLGTQKENIQDMFSKGRNPPRNQQCHGESNGQAILTSPQIKEIRRRINSGSKQIDLAKEYNVSKQTISAIFTGISWKR